ncbi:hypothetical protein GTA08_BOTSDO12707 [Botryosphaeria dothidea]|uniref:Uncharacterized protein n=1 Tax=Botryosphaeria dothidea TaxID=55169 RepID=A0A8H4J2K3_9PEZI|nr:hypothetical protein GTA08_BOTSDO12707 [Botryosphaeria dothidea]
MPAKTRSMAKLEAENVTERTNNNAAPVANVTSSEAESTYSQQGDTLVTSVLVAVAGMIAYWMFAPKQGT